jgi:hypothetical protein
LPLFLIIATCFRGCVKTQKFRKSGIKNHSTTPKSSSQVQLWAKNFFPELFPGVLTQPL